MLEIVPEAIPKSAGDANTRRICPEMNSFLCEFAREAQSNFVVDDVAHDCAGQAVSGLLRKFMPMVPLLKQREERKWRQDKQ